MAVGGVPPARGWAELVNAGGPVHDGLPGPKAVKVTVPVGAAAGAGAPVTVAVSDTGLPSTALSVASVAMATVAWVTRDVSLAALHADTTGP